MSICLNGTGATRLAQDLEAYLTVMNWDVLWGEIFNKLKKKLINLLSVLPENTAKVNVVTAQSLKYDVIIIIITSTKED